MPVALPITIMCRRVLDFELAPGHCIFSFPVQFPGLTAAAAGKRLPHQAEITTFNANGFPLYKSMGYLVPGVVNNAVKGRPGNAHFSAHSSCSRPSRSLSGWLQLRQRLSLFPGDVLRDACGFKISY